MSDEKFIVEVTGAPNLRFSGELLASASNKAVYNCDGEWSVYKLYKTSKGKYVCQIKKLSQWADEPDFFAATVCETNEEIINFFGHDDLAKYLYYDANIDYCLDV